MKKILRIGGYGRVSHEEQKKYGFSIEAQIEKIKKWCEEENNQLVDLYIDEGYTAGNMKRPRLLDMLNNLNNLDVIVFTRLDRFSRNVLEANKMLELLQQHNVALISIEEDDIDTSTADGMFMFQLKVSLAERELKKGSERIKSVFEYKIKNGQPISGTLPLGYKIVSENHLKRIDFDEKTIHIVKDIFFHFQKYHSIRKTMKYVNDKYNLNRCYSTYHTLIKNKIYTGHYKGNDNYCPAYITKEQFERNQLILKSNIRLRKSKHIHLFSGLLKCPLCGQTFAGQSTTKRGKLYYSYRCSGRSVNKVCSMKRTISELTLERFILENIEDIAKNYISEITNINPLEKDINSKRIKEIKEEIESLNYMFRKKRISQKEYDIEYEQLEVELNKLEFNRTGKVDLKPIQDFLNSNWKNIYHSLDRENKQSLWRNLIKEIVFDKDINISIIFL